jgi:hypothetical protein
MSFLHLNGAFPFYVRWRDPHFPWVNECNISLFTSVYMCMDSWKFLLSDHSLCTQIDYKRFGSSIYMCMCVRLTHAYGSCKHVYESNDRIESNMHDYNYNQHCSSNTIYNPEAYARLGISFFSFGVL